MQTIKMILERVGILSVRCKGVLLSVQINGKRWAAAVNSVRTQSVEGLHV